LLLLFKYRLAQWESKTKQWNYVQHATGHTQWELPTEPFIPTPSSTPRSIASPGPYHPPIPVLHNPSRHVSALAEDNSDSIDAPQIPDYRPLARRHDAAGRRVDEIFFSANNPQALAIHEFLHSAMRPATRDLPKPPPGYQASAAVNPPPIAVPSPPAHSRSLSSPVPFVLGRTRRLFRHRESDWIRRCRSDLCESCSSVCSLSSTTTFGPASSATSIRTEQGQSQDVVTTQCLSPTADSYSLCHIMEHSDAKPGVDRFFEEPKHVDSQSRRNTEPFTGSVLGDNIEYPSEYVPDYPRCAPCNIPLLTPEQEIFIRTTSCRSGV
jgi:hypothetical protein